MAQGDLHPARCTGKPLTVCETAPPRPKLPDNEIGAIANAQTKILKSLPFSPPMPRPASSLMHRGIVQRASKQCDTTEAIE